MLTSVTDKRMQFYEIGNLDCDALIKGGLQRKVSNKRDILPERGLV